MSDEPQFIHFKVPRAQYDALKAAIDAGFKPELDPAKIHARYTDFDLAEQVPRVIMYLDMGALMKRIHLLELALHEAGFRIAPADPEDGAPQ